MTDEFALLQPYWLFLLSLPAAWLLWRRYRPGTWPRLLPLQAMRYPVLAELHQRVDTTTDVSGYVSGDRYADRLLALAMCLMVIALSQPVRYTGEQQAGTASEPVDLVLVVGTAISMSLKDYSIGGQPVDRMTLTRHALDGFVNEYSGSAISLVILGNPPALWVPMTTDKDVVQDAISRIRPVLGGRLTDMGATLQLVRENLLVRQDTVVVVITDGGLQLGAISPLDASQALADAGFSLYVIAVGSADPDAQRSSTGGLIYNPINIAMLQQMATLGDGMLFHAQDAQAFADALAEIESRHRRPVPPPEARRLIQPWYPLPLVLSMLLLLVAVHAGGGSRHQAGRDG